MSEELKNAIEAANKYQLGQETAYGDNEHSLVIEAAQAHLDYQKQAEMRDKEVCFSESGDKALEAFENVLAVLVVKISHAPEKPRSMKDLLECRNNIQIVRTALTQSAEKDAAIRDLIEQLRDIDECFEAAYVEGLSEKMHESENLADLINRRLLPARDIATKALTKHAATIESAGE